MNNNNVAAVDVDSVSVMLSKLSQLWKTRAAVNQHREADYSALQFDPARRDFTEALLPFHAHPAWRAADERTKSRCLSYAWILYNLKTIYIEMNVVTPACEDIIKSPPVCSRNRALLQTVMAEALLDEALHTKMSVDACNYIYVERGLGFLDFVDFNLIGWRDATLAHCSAEWERRLTRFAIACASETLITDYLKVMAEDRTIQQVCHEVTRTHAADEWSHSSVFSFAATDVLSDLSNKERTYFKSVVEKTVHLFANNEMGGWKAVFSMINFPGAADILHDTGDSNEIGIYVDSVERLVERVGLNRMISIPGVTPGVAMGVRA